jgi:hypothetical protein
VPVPAARTTGKKRITAYFFPPTHPLLIVAAARLIYNGRFGFQKDHSEVREDSLPMPQFRRHVLTPGQIFRYSRKRRADSVAF